MTRGYIHISNKSGTAIASFDATVSFKKNRLNYQKRKMIKGKIRQSWYMTVGTYNISFENLPSETFHIINSLFETNESVVLFFKNETIDCIIDGDSFDISDEYSEELEDMLYKGNLLLEETVEEDIV